MNLRLESGDSKMNRITSLVKNVLLLSIFTGLVLMQDEMSLETAISFALENNHDIKIALNNNVIAENNASPGNAGLLPQLQLTAGKSYSVTDNTLTFEYSPVPIKTTGAVSQNNSAALGISGVLFNGGKNYYTYRSLLKSKDLTTLQTRELIESKLASVIRNYYNVALLEENVQIAKSTLAISRQRVARVEDSVAYGGSLSLELLNAKVDMQTDSINLLNVNLQLENARRELNLILGREVDAAIRVSPLVSFGPTEDIEFWLGKAEANSSLILSSNSRVEQSLLELKAARSGFYPSLTGSLSYELSRINSDSGTLRKGESAGITAGLNLSLDLFSGFRTLHNVRNARITMKSSEEELQLTKLTLRKQLLNAYSTYRNALQTVEVEKQSLETLKLNFERTTELYQLGQVTTTQFRESQLNWISGQSRLINEKYTAKFAEIELYRLSGLLMDYLGVVKADE